MKFNTKTRYGIRAMIELAMQPEGEGVLQKDISKRQEISYKYLDHLLASLKASGLIENAEGRMSGYVLTRDPGSISMYDVFKAYEPGLRIVDCNSDDHICVHTGRCAAKEFWEELNSRIVEYFENISLKDLARRQQQMNETHAAGMYYI